MLPADRYAALLPAPERLREKPLIETPAEVGELELQARWFAGEFGRQFRTTRGEPVEIVQFGVWNREAGPDFAEAAVAFKGKEPIRGCIELDPDVRDWERHGHATNPAYNDVILHVFITKGPADFFTRTLSNRDVPQISIDPAAIPGHPPNPVPVAKLGRCAGPLRALNEEDAVDILEAAAQFRLRKKAARLSRLAELHGPDDALYQTLAGALGYKNNKLPFTLLAQRLPLRLLRKAGADAEALLFGVAGFLDAPDLSAFEADTRGYLRGLWDSWWPLRAEYERLALPVEAWNFSGTRPANHPQRRVAALARIVAYWPAVRRIAAECDARGASAFFSKLDHEYWDRHFTLASRPSKARMALVGASRIGDILANVLFPTAFTNDPALWAGFRKLPAVLGNRRSEIAAIRLLQDHPARRALMRTAARQQGLLQIYEDFCMQDNSDCVRCLFPQRVATWEKATD